LWSWRALVYGGARARPPRSKVSMMIILPPQHGHGGRQSAGAAGMTNHGSQTSATDLQQDAVVRIVDGDDQGRTGKGPARICVGPHNRPAPAFRRPGAAGCPHHVFQNRPWPPGPPSNVLMLHMRVRRKTLGALLHGVAPPIVHGNPMKPLIAVALILATASIALQVPLSSAR
jgi:hypothetical protein